MKDFDYHLRVLADYIGGLEWWDNLDTKSRHIRTTRDGVVHIISFSDIMSMTENELLQYVINLLATKQIEASQEYARTVRQPGAADRINEINAELDILRGRVPTPKGYTIDITRAKELMAELKELMK